MKNEENREFAKELYFFFFGEKDILELSFRKLRLICVLWIYLWVLILFFWLKKLKFLFGFVGAGILIGRPLLYVWKRWSEVENIKDYSIKGGVVGEYLEIFATVIIGLFLGLTVIGFPALLLGLLIAQPQEIFKDPIITIGMILYGLIILFFTIKWILKDEKHLF